MGLILNHNRRFSEKLPRFFNHGSPKIFDDILKPSLFFGLISRIGPLNSLLYNPLINLFRSSSTLCGFKFRKLLYFVTMEVLSLLMVFSNHLYPLDSCASHFSSLSGNYFADYYRVDKRLTRIYLRLMFCFNREQVPPLT